MEFAAFSLVLLYFAPFTVAVGRRHPRYREILAVNVTLGWTGLGWFAALAWAWPPPWHRVRRRAPALRLLTPAPAARLSEPRTASARREAPLHVGLAAAALVLALATARTGVPGVSWWPERQGPPGPTWECIASVGALFHRAPSGPAVARLAAGCGVRVSAHHGGWKHVWRSTECGSGAHAPGQGWIRASASGR